MKTVLTTIAFILTVIITFAQTPTTFSYQAVLRDASGGILVNQDVEIGIVLLQGSATGSEVFSETHSVTTNSYGLVNLQIGSVNASDMESIDWSSGPYFIQISVDGTIMGTSQLLSVPFAMHAVTVENDNVEDADADPANELQDISLSGTELSISQGSAVDLSVLQDGTGTDNQDLYLYENYLSITKGNSVKLPFISSEQDDDATNELQVLSISNDTIYLTDGGKVKLPAETDPVFDASLAAAITAVDTANWNKDTSATNEIELPAQTGNAGKYLTTDGSNTSWEVISTAHDALTLGTANGLSLSGQTLSLETATTSSAGALSSSDKTKLNKIASYGTTASGNYPTAIGYATTAKGEASTAMGYETTASGDYSTAMGYNTEASGKYSTAMGYNTEASGDYFVTAMGYGTTASGVSSTAMGYNTTASGRASTAMGCDTEASRDYSTAMGRETTASGMYSTAMGYGTTANGYYSTAMGYNTTASGGYSTATGNKTTASGGYSTAMGSGIAVSGDYSFGINLDESASNAVSQDNTMAILGGKVGIGTSSPDYPLEVSGSASGDACDYAYYAMKSDGSVYTGYENASKEYSIVASSRIKASSFHAVSDRRIKTNIQQTNGKADLDLINKIEVVDYQYIDKVKNGNVTKKGFIAQQVEEVLPDAVGRSIQFIPDIYKKASKVVVDSVANTLIVTTLVNHNLKAGDQLRFITLGGNYEEEVLSVLSDNTFTVKKVEGDCSEVFVYGKKVDDFRAIDYDQVFSVGIGAIQELSRQNKELKQTIENLQNANTALKAEKDIEVGKLQTENSEIKQRLETLEALMKNTLNTIAEEKASALK